jgi:uncharacterized protein
MKNALILHGTGGKPDSNWFRWLSEELSKRGYQVWVPQLPSSDYPNTAKYISFFSDPKNIPPHWGRIGSNTIIIGHSSGAVAAMGILQHFAESSTETASTPIHALYLVGAFIDNLGWKDEAGKYILQGVLEPELDFKKIRGSTQKTTIFHSMDDPYCPHQHAAYLAVHLHSELIMMHGRGHFMEPSFPELLEHINNP